MKPRISFITLAVGDLPRALAFYRDGLGLPSQGIVGTEFALGAVAFFKLQPGLTLALWPRSSLAADTGLALPPPTERGAETATHPTTAPAVALAHNVDSVDEVQALLAQAERAGGRIVKPAQPTFYGGHAGYFQDPDGHLWEVAYNPGWQALG